MKRKNLREYAARIEALRGRFEAWRRSRSRGRTPEPLWRAAAQLARKVGVNPIARELGLDYYNLKRRSEEVTQSKRKVKPPRSSAGKFVEIELPAAVGRGGDCVVEIGDGSGTQLTVRLSGASAHDVATIAKALWSPKA